MFAERGKGAPSTSLGRNGWGLLVLALLASSPALAEERYDHRGSLGLTVAFGGEAVAAVTSTADGERGIRLPIEVGGTLSLSDHNELRVAGRLSPGVGELTALGGFPGPFIKFWEKLGGLESICRAMDGLKDRRATAVCALVAYSEKGPQQFEGRAEGTIASAPRGSNGFGWDAIFIPEGEARTWGEVSQAEKDARSHRRRAWELFAQRMSTSTA